MSHQSRQNPLLKPIFIGLWMDFGHPLPPNVYDTLFWIWPISVSFALSPGVRLGALLGHQLPRHCSEEHRSAETRRTGFVRPTLQRIPFSLAPSFCTRRSLCRENSPSTLIAPLILQDSVWTPFSPGSIPWPPKSELVVALYQALPARASEIHRTYTSHSNDPFISVSPLNCNSERGLQPSSSPSSPQCLANCPLIMGA